MAFSQLLQRRSSFFIRRNAFQMPVSWFSSLSSDTESEKPSQLKKKGMSKEQRAEAVDLFVKKYMETNPGVFPKATHIQNAVGGSWYTVKETLDRIKEKILVALQPQNDHSLIDSVPPLAPTASNSNLSDQPDSKAYTDLAVFHQTMDENIRHTAINAPAESCSDLVVDATASDVTNIHDSSGSCELHAASVLLSAKSQRKVSGSQKDASENIMPLLSRSQTEGTMELSAVSDSSQLELENGHMLCNKVHSSMCESSVRDLLLNSAKLSDLRHSKVNSNGYRDQQENKELTCSLLNDKSSLLRSSEKVSGLADLFRNNMDGEAIGESDLGHSKVKYTGYKNQQENKELTCSLLTDKSALLRSSEKVSGLAHLFRNNMDDEAKGEFKNEHQLLEGLQSGAFWFERERNSQVNQLSSSDSFSFSESPSNVQDTGLNKSIFTKHENHPPEEEMTISSETQNVVSKVTEPFAPAKKTGSLEDTNTINNRASNVMNNVKSDMFMQRCMGNLEDHKEEDGSKSFEIKHLIDCIKKLPHSSTTENTPTCKNDGSSNRSLSGETESLASLQGFGKKRRKVSEGTAVRGKLEHGPINILSERMDIDNDIAGHPEFADTDLVKSHLTNKKESNEIKDKFFLSKESDQNKAIIKFLKTVTESDLYNAFQDCGDILKVEISNVEGAFYQVAHVYFRTREGLRKALEKTDLCIGKSHPTVEAADLIEDISNRISIPSLIGDPNVPATLVKNPTRTVMIRKLTHDISSHHIEAALTFCGSNVTGFFLGSSNSVAYVEFETEDGKETALAKRSIDVLGKQLLISRIDIPRTTVVRISYPQSIKRGAVVKVCNSVGEVISVSRRHKGLFDVFYRSGEWPNMLNILNRLNGMQVDGRPLLAQPATVIPPEILRVLWRQPEERKHVKTTVQKLLHRVVENVPIRADFLDLVESFYRDKL